MGKQWRGVRKANIQPKRENEVKKDYKWGREKLVENKRKETNIQQYECKTRNKKGKKKPSIPTTQYTHCHFSRETQTDMKTEWTF